MTRFSLIAVVVCSVFANSLEASPQEPVQTGSKTSSQKQGEPRSKSGVAIPDSTIVFNRFDARIVLTQPFEQNTARPLSNYLRGNADRFYGIERYELSKVQCALYGADTGITLGIIAGALGMTAGLWDERTAWYVAGAAAVLGALRGASMADDPGFRLRIRWRETDRDPRAR